MHCCQLDCGRRTRQRKLQREPFRETICWPISRNRPKSILTKKTWCRSRGRREVGISNRLCVAQSVLIKWIDEKILVVGHVSVPYKDIWENPNIRSLSQKCHLSIFLNFPLVPQEWQLVSSRPGLVWKTCMVTSARRLCETLEGPPVVGWAETRGTLQRWSSLSVRMMTIQSTLFRKKHVVANVLYIEINKQGQKYTAPSIQYIWLNTKILYHRETQNRTLKQSEYNKITKNTINGRQTHTTLMLG